MTAAVARHPLQPAPPASVLLEMNKNAFYSSSTYMPGLCYTKDGEKNAITNSDFQL
jgi:hypothetical protein